MIKPGTYILADQPPQAMANKNDRPFVLRVLARHAALPESVAYCPIVLST
jgi:hypothetical protein